MIPIRDDNPTFSKPYVTVGLIVINCLVFLIEVGSGKQGMQEIIWKYGFVPAELVRSDAELSREMNKLAPEEPVFDPMRGVFVVRGESPYVPVKAVPAWINIFTAMFLHGGWMHLIGNMLFLWIFGNNIEDRLGHVQFVVFYLLTGLIGNLAHTLFQPSAQPLVGASGAISGVMGGYILVHPHAHILAVLPLGFVLTTVKLPAWVFLGVYLVFQNLFPAIGGYQQSPVAYLAHIGGFVAGMALIYLFPHRKVGTYARPARPIDDEEADFII